MTSDVDGVQVTGNFSDGRTDRRTDWGNNNIPDFSIENMGITMVFLLVLCN